MNSISESEILNQENVNNIDETEIFYKLVLVRQDPKTNEEFFTSTTVGRDQKLIYKFNEWTETVLFQQYEHKLGIMVFKTLDDVIRFYRCNTNKFFEIKPCGEQDSYPVALFQVHVRNEYSIP